MTRARFYCWLAAFAAAAPAPAAEPPVRIEIQSLDPGRIAFLPGSVTEIAVFDGGGALRIVDFKDPARPVVRLTLPGRFRDFAPMPDGFVTGGGDGMLRFWSHDGSERAPPLAMLGRALGPVAASASGRMVAAADAGGRIRIWRREGDAWSVAATVDAIPAGECDWDRGISDLVFSPDETLLAASPCPGGLAVWTTAGAAVPVEKPEAIEGAQGAHFTFSADSRFLAAHYRFQPGSMTFVWPIQAGRLEEPRRLTEESVTALAWHPRLSGFVVADTLGIDVLAPDGRALAPRIAAGASDLAVSADGSRLAAIEGRRVRLWDAAGKALPPEPFDEGSWFRRVAALPDRFAAAYHDGSLRFWRWSGEPIGPPSAPTTARRGNEGGVDFHLAVLPDGRGIATTDADGVVRFFSPEGEPRGTALKLPFRREHQYSRLDVAPAFGAEFVVAATPDRTALLRFGYDGRRQGEAFARQPPAIVAVAVNPRDGRIVTADYEHLRFWSSDGRALGAPVKLPWRGTVRALEFSPDGRLLAARGDSILWRAEAPERLRVLPGRFIGFTRDNRLASITETEIVLETAAGEPVASFPRERAFALAVVPDGSGVLMAGERGIRVRRFTGGDGARGLWGDERSWTGAREADGGFRIEFDRRPMVWRPGRSYEPAADARLSSDGRWRLREEENQTVLRRADGSGRDVVLPGSQIAFAASGTLVVTAQPLRDQVVALRLYDGDLKLVAEASLEGRLTTSIAVAPDGSGAALLDGARVRFVDRAGRWREGAFELGEGSGVAQIEYAPNGRWIAAFDGKRRLVLIDGEGRALAELASDAETIRRFAIAGDSRRIAVSDGDGRISVWAVDAESGRLGPRLASSAAGAEDLSTFGFLGERLWLQRPGNEIVLLDAALVERVRARFAPDGHIAALADGRHCGAGPIFLGRIAYRGAERLPAPARDALVDCAAVAAEFESRGR